MVVFCKPRAACSPGYRSGAMTPQPFLVFVVVYVASKSPRLMYIYAFGFWGQYGTDVCRLFVFQPLNPALNFLLLTNGHRILFGLISFSGKTSK